MRVKRPVNKQTPADQVFHRDRSPIAAVIAVVTVIAHGEIAVAGHAERLIGLRQKIMAGRITAIRRSSPTSPAQTRNPRAFLPLM